MAALDRLVLASLNQGARLLGVLERPCRNHLLQRPDVRAGAIQQAADDFPDGPYDSRYDYGLSDREEELDSWEPDELWPRPKLCGDVYHSPAGGTFVCGKQAGHRVLEGGDHESDGVTWHPVADGCCTYHAPAYFDDSPDVFRHGGQTKQYGPRPRISTARPHSSAPGTPEAPVVAGASPGGATHPVPPGERESEVIRVLGEHEAYDYAGHVECPHRVGSEVCDDWQAWREHVAPLLVAALYPMQPRPETEAQKPKWCGCASCDCGAFPPAHK